MLDCGYINSDMDGYAFRLRQGKRPTLEIIGFDFEYYRKDPVDAEKIKQKEQHYKKVVTIPLCMRTEPQICVQLLSPLLTL